jgi:hypothetical protein
MEKQSKNEKKPTGQSFQGGDYPVVLEGPFKAKRYTKAELGMLYGWGRDTLRRKLNKEPVLFKKLVAVGYKKHDKVLTKSMVAVIIGYYGEPFQ